MKALWYLYIGSVLVLGIGRTVQKIMLDTGGFSSRYGPALGAVLVSVGLIGYAMRRSMIHRGLWMVLWFLITAGMTGLAVLEVILLGGSGAPVHIHAIIVGGVIVLIPSWIGLYRYSFRSDEIWKRANSTVAGAGAA